MQIPASTTHEALTAHATITGSATNLVQKIMASENDIQGLLRLLTGPAKIPLASAIPQARSLIAGKLTTLVPHSLPLYTQNICLTFP